MNRSEYNAARAAYRAARHADRQWRPDPYAARNVRQVPPNTAGLLLLQLDHRIAECLKARPTYAPVRPGPRATFLMNWFPPFGRHARLALNARVALRSALQRMGSLSPAEARADAERMIQTTRAEWARRH